MLGTIEKVHTDNLKSYKGKNMMIPQILDWTENTSGPTRHQEKEPNPYLECDAEGPLLVYGPTCYN